MIIWPKCVKQASKQLGVLKRLGLFLTKQGKITIYNSFIVSNFNYYPLDVAFCSASSTNKIEQIQNKFNAMTFAFNFVNLLLFVEVKALPSLCYMLYTTRRKITFPCLCL